MRISGDIVTFLAAFVVLVGAFLWAGLGWWALFWCLAALTLGLVEYWSWRATGKTLSEQLGETMRRRPAVGWLLWSLLACGFLALLLHFIALSR